MYTMKPGYLVCLKTYVRGGVEYFKEDEDHKTKGNRDVKTWRTTRIVDDKKELERATKCRNAAMNGIRRQCTDTPFGLICTKDNRSDLKAAVKKARKSVDAFNEDAKHISVLVHVLIGRIAGDDEEAIRAMNEELKDSVLTMKQAIREMNPAAVRAAALKAKRLASIIDDEANAKKVSKAVKAARAAASVIARDVEKGGQKASKVLKKLDTKAIDALRFGVLDVDDVGKKKRKIRMRTRANRSIDVD